jgi:hypothetical protein
MLPMEEKSPTARNLNLSLNLQKTTSKSHNSSDTDEHNAHDDLIDENTKLLKSERDYSNSASAKAKTNGNVVKNGGNIIIYQNNLNNINNNNHHYNNNTSTTTTIVNVNGNSIIKNGGSTIQQIKDDDSTTTASINNNDETSSNAGDRKIIKMTKMGSKNIPLKR